MKHKQVQVITACKSTSGQEPLYMNSEDQWLSFEAKTSYGSVWVDARISHGKFDAFRLRNLWLASLGQCELIMVKRKWQPFDVKRSKGEWLVKDLKWPTLEHWFAQAGTLEAIVQAEYFMEDLFLVLETLEDNKPLRLIGLGRAKKTIFGRSKIV